MNLKREYISNIIGNTYKNWKYGDKILINSPCGSGKTHFIKQLITTNKHTGFLIVSNRTNLKKQYRKDLEGCKNFTSICYQSLQEELQKDRDYMKQYSYIIFDEFHHLLDSASYDRYTDIIYNEIIQGDYSKNIMVFMSATIGRFKDSLKHSFKDLKIYEQPIIDYSYIDKIHLYKKTNSLIEAISRDTTDSKWLIFVSNKDSGAKYKEALEERGINCKFIYSDKKQSKETKETMDEIVNNCIFSSKVLIATSILQEGVNLKDNRIKNVVTEIWEEVSTIQSINRIRVETENPNRINLYIRKRTKNGIIGKFSKISKKRELIEEFKSYVKNGKETEFIKEHYNRDTKKFFNLVDGIYYLDKDGSCKLNILSYLKLVNDYNFFGDLAENIAQDEDYQVNQVLKWFNLEDRTVIDLDGVIEEQHEETKTDTLKTWIKTHLEQRLFKEQQNELIELCGLKDKFGRLQKSISVLNAYLKEHYKVQLTSKRVTVNKKKLTIWEISNME